MAEQLQWQTGILSHYLQEGLISPLSYYFADFIARHSGQSPDSLLVISAALLSERNQSGDVCVDLAEYAQQRLFAEPELSSGLAIERGPAFEDWQSLLQASDCVGQPGDRQPLILDGSRLYLGKVWQDEKLVAAAIEQRLSRDDTLAEDRLRDSLQQLFPTRAEQTNAGEQQTVDWQKLASALAASRRFAVISGGPGTGKTTTVIKVLVLLLEQNPHMRIRLAAPTGKAAARMVESIRSRKADVPMSAELRTVIPDTASTLHRLLGYRGQGRLRYDRDNTLPLDCLVVDEASMIDLNMMARLVEALPDTARLILLGDRDQLASVDAGNVLGDITGRGAELQYDNETATWLSQITDTPREALPISEDTPGIANAIGLLRTSYRFKDSGGIGKLARLVNQGAGKEALDLFRDERGEPDEALRWSESVDPDHFNADMLDWAVEQFSACLRLDDPGQALKQLDSVRVLCARHEGPLGDQALNQQIESRLRSKGLLAGGEDFRGKPVMITVNDYELQLFNGDIGLLWPDAKDQLRAWFPMADGGLRDIPVRSLPDHVPAWAMTVHKSQGSEFDAVVLVLPADSDNRLLSRELLYTAITRARERVIIHGSRSVFQEACQRRVRRSSGLASILGWSD